MSGLTLKYGVLTGKGVALKRIVAGASVGLALASGLGGGTMPVPPVPVARELGLFSYAPPAGVTGSACYVRDKKTKTNVRTLWNNRKETSTASKIERWDGRLYDLSPAPAGEYEIVINYHSITHTYQGGIGNTSLNLADLDGMWHGYDFVYDGVQVGSKVFWAMGYVESKSPINATEIGSSQRPTPVLDGSKFIGQTVRRLASDDVDLYGTAYRTIGTKQSYVFVTSATAPGIITRFASLDQQATNLDNIIGGLTVQKKGTVIVVTYPALNRIDTYRKGTLERLQTITTFMAPGACSVDAQDRLVLYANGVVATYTLGADGKIGATVGTALSGIAAPFTVKTQGNLTLVTDHGNGAQNLRAYTTDGSLAWVHGTTGGQNVDARVLPNRFCFATSNKAVNWSSVVPLDNGKFWVVEPGGNRMILFHADRTPVGGKEGLISYRSNCYTFALNQTDPTDLCWKYQRFKVGYSDDIANDWAFTHNYLPFMPAEHFDFGGDHGDQQGIEYATVFKSLYTDPLNGRTYAYCTRPKGGQYQEVERTDTGLRLVGGLLNLPYSFDKEGSRVLSRYTGAGNANYGWEVEPRLGFDASGNRILGAVTRPTTIIGVNNDDEPYDRSGYANGDAYLKTTGGYRPLYLPNLVRYIGGKFESNGWRLGLVKEGNREWDMLLNKSTGGISYYGGQPLDGYYSNGDHATSVLKDKDEKPILDANGKEILLPIGYGGSVVRVCGRYIIENRRGEFAYDGQEDYKFVWTEWGTMPYAFGTDTRETRAYTVATGKKIYPGFSGNVMETAPCQPTADTNVMYVWNAEEAGAGLLNRTKLVGLDTVTDTVVATVDVAPGAEFGSLYPAGTVDLLAKMPAKGDMWRPCKTVYENPGCGWTQSKPDQGDNRYAGQTFWKGEIGRRTYDIFKPNGVEFFFQGDNTTVEWVSDPVATSRTGNYKVILKEQYLDNFANNGEQSAAGSGGLYRHLKDLNGKILLRSYIRNINFASVDIIVNGQKLVSGASTELTPLWRKMRQGEDWQITHTDGVVTVQYSDYPAITITQPFEAGGDFASLKNVSYLAWDRGQKRDRVVSLQEALFIPTA